jgi:hypothetical protein
MKEKYGNRKKPKRQVRFEDSSSSSDSDDKPNSDNGCFSLFLELYLFIRLS